MSAMPYFDDFDLSTVDILLISQYVVHFPCPANNDSISLNKRSLFLCGRFALTGSCLGRGVKCYNGQHMSRLVCTIVTVAQSMRTSSTLYIFISEDPISSNITLHFAQSSMPYQSRFN